MTLIDIVNYSAALTGDISSEAIDFGRKAMRLKYATLYDSHNWREAMRTIDGIPLDPNLNGAFFLPYDAEEVIFCSLSYDGLSYTRLIYHERDWIERFATPAFNLPGNTPWFYRGENLAWPFASPGVITFATAEPNPFPVYIAGLDVNGLPVNESFSLQGINNPGGGSTGTVLTPTVNAYSQVMVLSKGATDTPMIVTDSSTPANTLRMPGGSTEFLFTQIILYPTPLFAKGDGTPQPIYARIQVKLKPDPLTNDMSVPRVSHIWEALVCFCKAALWERMQQTTKGQAANQDGMAHITAAISVEKNQAEFRQQAVPMVYERSDYLADGGYWFGYPSSSNPFGL